MKNSISIFVCLLCLLFSEGIVAQYTSSEWSSRDRWMNTDELFNLADLEFGAQVADIGCHEGYLSIRLARAIGDKGKVYAVDVRADRLEKLKKNSAKRKLRNIETIQGDYDNPNLPKEALDVVFIVDTYHEMESYMTVLGHVKESLKKGGKLVLLEKLKSHAKNKIRTSQVASHTLAMPFVEKELKTAGFTIQKRILNFGNWENDTSKVMWVLIASKP